LKGFYIMQLESKTLNILRNFSTINPSMIFKEGNSLTTISPNSTVIAKAAISETIPKRFAIAEMSKFLGAMSLFEQPELEVMDTHVVIKKGDQQVNFTFGEESLIVAPTKDVKMPDADVEFDLSESVFLSLMKAMAVLKLSEVAVVGDGNSITVETCSTKNSAVDTFKVKVGQTNHTFRFIFRQENLKLINDSYKVKVSKRGIAEFAGKDITYWVATEASSKFDS